MNALIRLQLSKIIASIAHAFQHDVHTVISEECTGCELCIEPCPVDCIKMETPDSEDSEAIKDKRSSIARSRYEFKQQRILREKNEAKANRATNAEKKQAIADAMARLKMK